MGTEPLEREDLGLLVVRGHRRPNRPWAQAFKTQRVRRGRRARFRRWRVVYAVGVAYGIDDDGTRELWRGFCCGMGSGCRSRCSSVGSTARRCGCCRRLSPPSSAGRMAASAFIGCAGPVSRRRSASGTSARQRRAVSGSSRSRQRGIVIVSRRQCRATSAFRVTSASRPAPSPRYLVTPPSIPFAIRWSFPTRASSTT